MEIKRPFTDPELLHAIRTGIEQDDAIRHLYRSYFGITRGYICQNNGTETDAEDIFQEVVLAFIGMVKKEKFRGECSVGTFLHVLSRNTWLNELKKRGRSRHRDEAYEKDRETTGMDISHYIMHREMRSELLNMVDALGETCKKILLSFYYENLPMKEILKITSFENEQVVRNKKYKCLKQLEQHITQNPALAKNLRSILAYE